ncbi:DUF2062 domain-containing protein [Massilia glaciei]|uniref:DUF2062 domain-containing protein n=1 Tax=Massilia glaciei TaxID=1524097 RepID=A0A2U2HLV0_9BURK|nr:DUF2062 domain-containing protein [Massilia glaciei]
MPAAARLAPIPDLRRVSAAAAFHRTSWRRASAEPSKMRQSSRRPLPTPMRFPYFTLPSPQSLRQSRLLKPLGRYLHHHFLWQFNRRAVAGGLAAGLFSGLILPLGQIGLAAVAAIVFRVNLPVAALSTLVTNPLTVGPI